MSSLEIGALAVMAAIGVGFAWYLWSERKAPQTPAREGDGDDEIDWHLPSGD